MLCSQDECSFVSLRDVERCMIVFEYFFEQMGLFSERMNDKATKENKEVNSSLIIYFLMLLCLLLFIAAIDRSCVSFSCTGLKCMLPCQAARQN